MAPSNARAVRTSGDFDPAWSPGGRRIAYVHSTGSTVGPGQAGTEIWVMNADGSGKRRLTRNVSFDGGPTLPRGMRDVRDLPMLTAAMLDRGWSEQRIRKFYGGNLLRVVRQVTEKRK